MNRYCLSEVRHIVSHAKAAIRKDAALTGHTRSPCAIMPIISSRSAAYQESRRPPLQPSPQLTVAPESIRIRHYRAASPLPLRLPSSGPCTWHSCPAGVPGQGWPRTMHAIGYQTFARTETAIADATATACFAATGSVQSDNSQRIGFAAAAIKSR
jgi:hypothetical protein